MNRFKILVLLASPLFLPSCVPVIAAGAGTAIGVSAVQEGGLSQTAKDAAIQTQINDLWFKYNFEMFRKLDMTVDQGRVLLTGVVQDPKFRVEAVRLAWQPAGVVQVINEIKVADSDGIVGYAKDAWISTRLRTALVLDGDVESLNYSIDTVQGAVYLMGYAQDQQELDKVIQHARTIENVRSVVSYVKMVGSSPIAKGTPPQAQGQQGEQAPDSADLWGDNNQGGGEAPVYDNQPIDNKPYGQEFNQPASGGGSGAPVAPVSDGEPIDWNNGGR